MFFNTLETCLVTQLIVHDHWACTQVCKHVSTPDTVFRNNFHAYWRWSHSLKTSKVNPSKFAILYIPIRFQMTTSLMYFDVLTELPYFHENKIPSIFPDFSQNESWNFRRCFSHSRCSELPSGTQFTAEANDWTLNHNAISYCVGAITFIKDSLKFTELSLCFLFFSKSLSSPCVENLKVVFQVVTDFQRKWEAWLKVILTMNAVYKSWILKSFKVSISRFHLIFFTSSFHLQRIICIWLLANVFMYSLWIYTLTEC